MSAALRSRPLGRLATIAAASGVLALVSSGMAVADTLQDTIADNGTGVSLVAGSTTSGTAGIRVLGNAAAGDPDPGCNIDAGESPLSLDILTPPGVTAKPDPLLITSCGTDFTVSFTASSIAESGNVKVAVLSGPAGGGTYVNQVDIPITITQPANTKPTLTLPSDITTGASGASGAVVTYTATANDAQDGALTPTCTPASGSTFAIGTTTVNCSVTDSGSLTTTGSFKVAVADTTGPVLSLPSTTTAAATSSAGAPVTYTATANDAVDGSVPVTCSPTSGSTFGLGDTTVNCSATDAANNKASGSFKVTVRDTAPPVLTLPENLTREATSSTGATVTYTASANDAIDGSVPVSCTPASGSTFGLGDTTVNCSATDAAGNKSSASFKVTVADTAPPVLTLPENLTREATSSTGATVTYTASANDAIDGSVPVSCTPASGSTFGLGDTTVNCSATDAAGNKASASFKVTVADTTKPVLDLPSSTIAEATSSSGATVNYTASASDLVDGTVPVTCSQPSGSAFGLGDTTVNCSATDAAGNKATGSFKVTVADTTKPALTLPANITEEATSSAGATVNYTASASDLVDGAVGVSCLPASGATFGLGDTTVTCEATDKTGNKATGSFKVTVSDTTAPAGITFVGGPAAGGSYLFGSVPTEPTCTATDAVSTPVCTVTGYGNAVGTHTLTATATDSVGNKATKTLSYTVSAWTLKGFYSPVDMGGVWNTVKGGSTVPLKFEVFAGSELTSTSAVKSFTQKQVTCPNASATIDEIEIVSTGGTSLRYDSTGGQFIQNWATPKKPGTCHVVTMTALDGSSISANFTLK